MSTSLLTIFAAGAAAADGPPAWLAVYLPMVAFGGMIWFLFLRPQMRQQKEHKTKLEGLKKGDQVLTGGGFIGRILRIDDTYVDVELAPGMKVKALKSTITDVIPPGGTPAAND